MSDLSRNHIVGFPTRRLICILFSRETVVQVEIYLIPKINNNKEVFIRVRIQNFSILGIKGNIRVRIHNFSLLKVLKVI